MTEWKTKAIIEHEAITKPALWIRPWLRVRPRMRVWPRMRMRPGMRMWAMPAVKRRRWIARPMTATITARKLEAMFPLCFGLRSRQPANKQRKQTSDQNFFHHRLFSSVPPSPSSSLTSPSPSSASSSPSPSSSSPSSPPPPLRSSSPSSYSFSSRYVPLIIILSLGVVSSLAASSLSCRAAQFVTRRRRRL